MGMLKGYMLICGNAEGVHAHLWECWRGTCSSVEMLKGYMLICRNAEGVHAHLWECWRGTCSSVGMLKGYMLICRNAEGVHAHLSECWRGTCSSMGMLKGYMLICGNAEGVHGKRKVWNPCSAEWLWLLIKTVCETSNPPVTSSTTVLFWTLHAVSPTPPTKICLNVFAILLFRPNCIVLSPVSYVCTTEKKRHSCVIV